MKLGFEIEGAEEMKAKLSAQKAAYQGAVGAALYQEGLAVQALAVHKTPVDTGRLRATAFTAPPEIEGGEISVTVGFGTDYAVFVHERTEARHPTGEAKFLERAFDERAVGYQDRLMARIDELAAAGVTATPIAPSTPEGGEG